MPIGAWEAPRSVETVKVFLSSANDAARLRDRVQSLILMVFNAQLQILRIPFRLEVVRWEEFAAQRSRTGHTNDMFVDQLTDSDLIIVLLFDELRPGTKEELEAALVTEAVDIAVLKFGRRRGDADGEDVQQFLKRHRDHFLYKQITDCDSDEAWEELVRILAKVVLERLWKLRLPEGGPYLDDVG